MSRAEGLDQVVDFPGRDAVEASLHNDDEQGLSIRRRRSRSAGKNEPWRRLGIFRCRSPAVVVKTRGRVPFGQWTFVQASRPGELNGHAWLEWQATDGTVEFSIDLTLHQFAGHRDPFIGDGRTPAANEFTDVNYRGSIWEWPYLGTESQIFRRLIREVRELVA
ncbi:hypothetical protein RCH22_000538 [Cryobacterium psychrotolerans]|nr:hypothetical protein [Cryobacterium psychrotolerans]